jgi:hypothetical protein
MLSLARLYRFGDRSIWSIGGMIIAGVKAKH